MGHVTAFTVSIKEHLAILDIEKLADPDSLCKILWEYLSTIFTQEDLYALSETAKPISKTNWEILIVRSAGAFLGSLLLPLSYVIDLYDRSMQKVLEFDRTETLHRLGLITLLHKHQVTKEMICEQFQRALLVNKIDNLTKKLVFKESSFIFHVLKQIFLMTFYEVN